MTDMRRGGTWFIGDGRAERRLARAMNGIDIVVHATVLK